MSLGGPPMQQLRLNLVQKWYVQVQSSFQAVNPHLSLSIIKGVEATTQNSMSFHKMWQAKKNT